MNATDIATGFNGDWLAVMQTYPGSYALAVVTTTASVAALMLWWRSRRRHQAVLRSAADRQIEALESRCKAQASAVLMLSERVRALEEYLELVGSRQQRMDQDRQRKEFYQQAIGLAAQSVSADELKQRCAISDVEAELITLLYGEQRASAC